MKKSFTQFLSEASAASEAKLPVRFIGAGEKIRDLRPFNSFEFIEALLTDR